MVKLKRRGNAAGAPAPLRVRRATAADLAQVIAIDARATGLAKPGYWAGILRRYGRGARSRFLVAEADGRIVGYIVGEVRDWEFGSPPCGWVFGIGVPAETRESGVATRLLEALTAAFRRQGVAMVRTLIARDNRLVLSFFRSQGMTAAPVIPLEKEIG
ncbi:MAG: GNAT family N-acetyltransferase [Betaproteobacteria bacterium]|nr:GNAT family N-acetyltransferase [Betaproteobacteria bacterium]MDH4325145.1 GNAT family N-acetyltransferase [Betaproteobacteria bacterium]MDH5210164.1 GNAT family N-acetyltransferase [Betaproteobacteria bacterium]MDH5578645.1 GNAT family N-acetyltransferase [Betaproteobacteria bacterium]